MAVSAIVSASSSCRTPAYSCFVGIEEQVAAARDARRVDDEADARGGLETNPELTEANVAILRWVAQASAQAQPVNSHLNGTDTSRRLTRQLGGDVLSRR